jgi:NAD-dependent dihydropyrimidine dehydrogenase PreA subunit
MTQRNVIRCLRQPNPMGASVRTDDHPTVIAVRNRTEPPSKRRSPLTAADLCRMCLDAGADDAGVVRLDGPSVGSERAEAEEALPGARTFLAFVVKMNRDSVRSPLRSVANVEFHHAGDATVDVARKVVEELNEAGHRAINPAVGFPHEMERFPGKSWVIAHKVVAVAAGLGQMGIHRNVIHPKFGNFVVLGVVITDAEVETSAAPLEFNPCLECKLCVTACPVGAITNDGGFDFQACYTHNYRDFMSGFTDWAAGIAEAVDGDDYRATVSHSESASMWQSLAYRPNYKAAYCMAVCPAGEDVIGPWLTDRRGHRDQVVEPLRAKHEPVYVLPDSHAQRHASDRFPHKSVRVVHNGLPDDINAVLESMSPHHGR